MRALLVVDHPGMRDLLSLLCLEVGLSPACADSAADASRQVDVSGPPSVVLVDLDLRGARSREVLRWTDRSPSLSDVPVIALVGPELDVSRRVVRVEKPFSIAEVMSALASAACPREYAAGAVCRSA